MPKATYQAHINKPPKQGRPGRPTGFKDPRKIEPLPKKRGRPLKSIAEAKLEQERNEVMKLLVNFWK